MSPTPEAVERAAKAEKEYLERIKKEQISQKVLINTLFEKRGTMISALKSLNNGSITKSDYEKKFKQFTWWIKREVEKMGGHIVDNSANYVNCPDCSHPVLVLWTPKHMRYFLGCSEYCNGCKWEKTIWLHDNS